MKTKNFPERRARRIAKSKRRSGLRLTDAECALLQEPTDIRIRRGRAQRGVWKHDHFIPA